MTNVLRLVANLVSAAKLARTQKDPDVSTRKRLALCAVQVAVSGAWAELDEALSRASGEVADHMMDAIEYVVEHPVFLDKAGRSFNARLFLIPVSQVISDNVALQYLPHGEIAQQLLQDTFCPNGKGILLNRLLSEDFLTELSYFDIWELTRSAFRDARPDSAGAVSELYFRPEMAVASGLHFMPFMAFAPSDDCDAMLDMDGDELEMKSLTVMDAINSMLSEKVASDGVTSLRVCLHLPQPFFYDDLSVEMAHDSFLFAAQLTQWVEEAESEGETLRISAQLDIAGAQSGIIVTGYNSDVEAYAYRFWVAERDIAMHAELANAITELVRPHGLSVSFSPDLLFQPDNAMGDMLALSLMPAPTTLQ